MSAPVVTAPGWWRRLKDWLFPSRPPIRDRRWLRGPTRSVYLIDDFCVALVVSMDVDSFPGYRWKIEIEGGESGVEPTQEEAEAAAERAAEARWSWL